MRFDAVAGFSLFLCLTTAHLQQPHHAQHQPSQQHMSRRERLFHDIGVALSGVWPPRMRDARSQRKMVKRGGVMSHNQCILRAPNALVQQDPHSTSPANGTSTSARGTNTGKGGATTAKTSTTTGKGSSPTTTTTPAASTPSSAYKKKWDAVSLCASRWQSRPLNPSPPLSFSLATISSTAGPSGLSTILHTEQSSLLPSRMR